MSIDATISCLDQIVRVLDLRFGQGGTIAHVIDQFTALRAKQDGLQAEVEAQVVIPLRTLKGQLDPFPPTIIRAVDVQIRDPQNAAVKNAATAWVLGVLRSSRETKRPSARAQLESLDEETLAQLLAMLVETKKGGAPKN